TMRTRLLLSLSALSMLGACSSPGALRSGADARAGCATLVGVVDASKIALPNGAALIESAVLSAPSGLTVAERGPTPAATITPAAPEYCKVLGRIAPVDPRAPSILFQVN